MFLSYCSETWPMQRKQDRVHCGWMCAGLSTLPTSLQEILTGNPRSSWIWFYFQDDNCEIPTLFPEKWLIFCKDFLKVIIWIPLSPNSANISRGGFNLMKMLYLYLNWSRTIWYYRPDPIGWFKILYEECQIFLAPTIWWS